MKFPTIFILLDICLLSGPFAFAQTTPSLFKDDFEQPAPSTAWKGDSHCGIAIDPISSTNHVLHLDGHGDIPQCDLTTSLPDAFTLDFRARYHTDFPGMATGGKPDGVHTPNWHIKLGGSLALEESYIWDGVLLSGDGPVARKDGAHAPDKWFHYQISKNKERLQVFVDGISIFDRKLAADQTGLIGFTAQDEDLWIDDVTITPWQELKAVVVNKDRDPDVPINEDFSNGLSSLWNSVGGWRVTDDPDQRGHKVLYAAPEHRDANLTTLAQNYDNYTMEMRVRVQADHDTWPHNDGFFGFWGIGLRNSQQGNLIFNDEYIWGRQGFDFSGAGYASDARHVKMGLWQDIKAVSSGDHFQIFLNGDSISEAIIPGVPSGAVNIHVMDERIWIASLKLTLHPEALLYDTFSNGISADRWNSNTAWTAEGAAEGNQYVKCTAAEETPLTSRQSFEDGILAFKTRIRDSNAQYPWTVLVRSKNANSLALRYDAKNHQLQLGQLTRTDFKVIHQEPASPPEKDAWSSYRVVIANGLCTVVQGVAPLFTTPIETVAGSLGLISASGAADFDDILVAPLLKPTFSLKPLQVSSICLPHEEKGALLSLENSDILSHHITGTIALESPRGEVLSTRAITRAIKGGEKLPGLKLIVEETKPGDYMLHIVLNADGAPLTDWKYETVVLPEVPVFQGDYRSKLGLCNGQPDLMVKLGAQRERGGVLEGTPRSDGTLDFSSGDKAISAMRAAHLHMDTLYMDVAAGWKQEGIDKISQTYGSVAKHYAGPEDILFSIWNEPNHGGFWTGSPNSPIDYMAVVKATYNAIKDGDPNAVAGIGELSSCDSNFMRGIMDYRGGDYADEITYHPYGYPLAPEKLIVPNCDQIKAIIDEYGGWFDHEVTEQGYPTSTSGNGVPEDIQAYFHVRTQLLCNGIDYLRSLYIYDFGDWGVNAADNEARFGIIRFDGTAKPCYRALAIMTRALANTNYAGTLTTDPGTYVQVYRRYDGKIVLAAWAPQNAEIFLETGIKAVTCTGFFGDVTALTPENGHLKVKLGPGPVYLTGDDLNASQVLQAAANWNREKTYFINEHLAKLHDAEAKASLTAEFHAITDPVTQMLPQAATHTPADALKKSLDALFAWAEKVIDLGKSGKLTRDEAGIVTEGVYRYAVSLECPLMVLNPANPDANATRSTLAAAKTAMQARTGSLGSQPIVERMIRFGDDHLHTATSLASVDPTNSAVETYLAGKIGEMAQAFVAVDPVIYRKTVFNILPKFVETGDGDHPKIASTFTNGQDIPLAAEVEIAYPDDWKLPPERIAKTISPGEKWTGQLTLQIPDFVQGGVYTLKAQSKLGDQPFDSLPIRVTVESPAEFYAGPLSSLPDRPQPLVITVVNSFSEPLQGTLRLIGPDGETLIPSPGDTDKVSIPAEKSQKLTFILGPQKRVDFNEYSVHAVLTDESGKVMAQESVPLDLPLTQFTRSAVPMNGALDVWKSAYPNHLRAGSKGLDPKNLGATLYTLYDDSNFYFLVRVTDDIQNQTHIGTDLWQGDSIQVSFDPKHEKTGGAYGPNDVELGFALASGSGKLLSVTYVSPVKNIMDNVHYNVIRDESQKTTTYIVSIPFDQFKGLTSKEGTIFGFNAAVHDSDRSFVREHMLELTEGTSAKNPSNYYDWVLLKKN